MSNNVNLLGSGQVTVTGNPGTNTLTISLGAGIATTYTANSGSATPALNNLNLLATVAAAGTTPFTSVGSGSTITYTIQRSQAAGASAANIVGLAAFSNTQFAVDANGFVTLSGTGVGQTITGNSGGALSPTAGNWNIFGAAVAAGTTPVASSGTGSTLTLNVQRSQAIASTNASNVGLAAFDSARFTVDGNGFVSLSGTGVGQTITGDTGGALPPTAGNWNIVGSSPVAGTNPVRTTGSGSTLTVNVQKAQAIASTNATNVGLAAFNSAQFSVDSNGFVSALTSIFPWIDQATGITLAVNTGYFVTAATTQTLPAAPTQGQVVKIVADTTGAVVVTANTGQVIRVGTTASSTAGSMTSTLQGDSLELVFRAATSTWISIATNGVWVSA
jgi:hypothetical protein